MSHEDFIADARGYGRALASARSGREIRELWKTTNLPYQMACPDPHAPEYQAEVIGLFKSLTDLDYRNDLEMTSTKQSDADFEIGYPWISRDLAVAAAEMAKPVQVLRALQGERSVRRVVEFGSGWGNLALPLARIGLDVTAIDIDGGFLARLRRIADREGVLIETLHADFVAAAETMEPTYDAVIFQSSFHHCANFTSLIAAIRDHVLTRDGRIFFFSEPIFRNYDFPWGLRYDGEALWAIIRNHWLELGFDQDFFVSMMNQNGFVVERVPGIEGLVGPGWKAAPAAAGLAFSDVVLPSGHDRGFHPVQGSEPWRFCRARASLPGHVGAGPHRECVMTFRNFLPKTITLAISAGNGAQTIRVEPSETRQIAVAVADSEIHLRSETFIADEVTGNSDMRELGLAIEHVLWRSYKSTLPPPPGPPDEIAPGAASHSHVIHPARDD